MRGRRPGTFTEKTFNFGHYARFWLEEAVENGDLQKQREILGTLGSNLKLKDGILRFEPPQPIKLIKEALETILEAKATLEPRKMGLNRRKKKRLLPLQVHDGCGNWLPVLNKIRTFFRENSDADF